MRAGFNAIRGYNFNHVPSRLERGKLAAHHVHRHLFIRRQVTGGVEHKKSVLGIPSGVNPMPVTIFPRIHFEDRRLLDAAPVSEKLAPGFRPCQLDRDLQFPEVAGPGLLLSPLHR